MNHNRIGLSFKASLKKYYQHSCRVFTPFDGNKKQSDFSLCFFKASIFEGGSKVPCNVLLLLLRFEKVSFIYGNNSFHRKRSPSLGDGGYSAGATV